MTWLAFLSNASAVLHITADVIIIYYVFPAFRQTGQRAFLLIGVACMVGAFDTVCDHTIAYYPMGPDERLIYRTLRTLTYFLAVVLDAIGSVLLVQSYLRLLQTKPLLPPDGNLPR